MPHMKKKNKNQMKSVLRELKVKQRVSKDERRKVRN